MPINPAPPMIPGTMPATNSCTTDVSAITAYRIIGIDGGMITASVAADDIDAAANADGYPLLFMPGIRIEPSAATSATAEPEISAKNSDAPIDTCASPPRIHPNSDDENAM